MRLVESVVEFLVVNLLPPALFGAAVVFLFGFGTPELDAIRFGLARFFLALLCLAETVQIDDLCHRLLAKFTRL
jgi:hypothetical protein